MSFAAANRARKHTKPAAAKATEPQAEAPPILGVDLKGELLDVELAKIIDPKLPSDRLERDGDDDPGWDAVVAIEKECGRQFALFDAWRDGHSGVVDLIAKALGVDLPAAPAVESFYPKEATKAKGVTESDLDAVDAGDDE